MTNLSRLPKLKGKGKPAKRIGRGYGSGKGGHTVGKGQKGQKTRGKTKIGFEGGQLPLYRRLPHRRGFKRAFREDVAVINLGQLEVFDAGSVVSPRLLLDAGLLREIPRGGVKLLGQGEVKKRLAIKGFKLSQTAKDKIIKAGGKIDA